MVWVNLYQSKPKGIGWMWQIIQIFYKSCNMYRQKLQNLRIFECDRCQTKPNQTKSNNLCEVYWFCLSLHYSLWFVWSKLQNLMVFEWASSQTKPNQTKVWHVGCLSKGENKCSLMVALIFQKKLHLKKNDFFFDMFSKNSNFGVFWGTEIFFFFK